VQNGTIETALVMNTDRRFAQKKQCMAIEEKELQIFE